MRYDSKLSVSVRPPRVTINAENKLYLQFLDALDDFDKAPIDAKEPYALLFKMAKDLRLDYRTLLFFANRFYNQKTIIRLAHVAGAKEPVKYESS